MPIHDLYVRALKSEELDQGSKLELIQSSDHLLRRFGFAEMVTLNPEQARPSMAREVADEVWALVAGSVQFTWHDQRRSSPTRGAIHQMKCEEPTLVLVPFGVEFEVLAMGGAAQLIRFSSHETDQE